MKKYKMIKKAFYYCDQCGKECGHGFSTREFKEKNDRHLCSKECLKKDILEF